MDYAAFESTDSPVRIDDATILEYTWADGAYTLTEPEWDSSLFFDDSGGTVLTGYQDSSTQAVENLEDVDGVSYSFAGVAYTTIGVATCGLLQPGGSGLGTDPDNQVPWACSNPFGLLYPVDWSNFNAECHQYYMNSDSNGNVPILKTQIFATDPRMATGFRVDILCRHKMALRGGGPQWG
jgi:hypothetical protein